jgi:hypothetical protein
MPENGAPGPDVFMKLLPYSGIPRTILERGTPFALYHSIAREALIGPP